MSKAKPIVVILVAIGLAASAAVYMSRQGSETPKQAQDAVSTPTVTLVSGGGRLRGTAGAPVTLVEFGDYQCPSCGAYHPMVSELLRRYPEKVKFEFHHYPLVQMHRNAMAAAMAAEAAGDQGRYWEMHDMLFEYQNRWSNSSNPQTEFLTYAAGIGLNANQFMQSMRSPDTQTRILQDVTRGRDSHVQGTPTFYVNGRLIEPLPRNVDEFIRVVDDQLRAAR